MKKGKILMLGMIGVLLLMLVGCSDSLTGNGITPGTAGTVTVKPNSGGTYSVQDLNGNTIPTTQQTNGDGTITISGLDPNADVMIIVDGQGNGTAFAGGQTYVGTPSGNSSDDNLADILAALKAQGASANVSDLIMLEKVFAILGFSGSSGNTIKDAIVDVYKEFAPSANFYLNQYLDISGWNQNAAYASGKTAYAKAKSDFIKQMIAQGGAANTEDRKSIFYSGFAQLGNDFVNQGGSLKLIGNLMLSVGMVDDLASQTIAQALVNAGVLSVRKQSLFDGATQIKINRDTFFNAAILYGISGIASGLITTVSDTGWKAALTALHTTLNNLLVTWVTIQTQAELNSANSTAKVAIDTAVNSVPVYSLNATESTAYNDYIDKLTVYKTAKESVSPDTQAINTALGNVTVASNALKTAITDTDKYAYYQGMGLRKVGVNLQ